MGLSFGLRSGDAMAKKTKKKKKPARGKNHKVVRRPYYQKKKAVKRNAKRARVAKVVIVSKKRLTKVLKPLQNTSLIKGGKQQQKVEALIRLGRERGYVTYDEILREFPTIEDNVLLLEEMYERFTAAGIDVLEGGGMLEDTSADSVLA